MLAKLRAVIVSPESESARVSQRGVGLCALLVSGESDSTRCDTTRSRLFGEYLCENKSSSETILACLSRTRVDSIYEKKSHWQLQFFSFLFWNFLESVQGWRWRPIKKRENINGWHVLKSLQIFLKEDKKNRNISTKHFLFAFFLFIINYSSIMTFFCHVLVVCLAPLCWASSSPGEPSVCLGWSAGLASCGNTRQ